MAPPKPNKVLVAIDVMDELTFDREFVRSIKYSPYVMDCSEMSARNRKAVINRDREADPKEPLINKFIIELYPDKFGDFAAQFLANPERQRTLTFLDYDIEGRDEDEVPDEVVKFVEEQDLDMDEILGDDQVTYIYQLATGPEIDFGDDDDDGGEYPDLKMDRVTSEESEDDEEQESKASDPSVLLVEDLDDGDEEDEEDEGSDIGEDREEMEDRIEDLTMSGQAFVIDAPKVLQ
jgi:hypothetical protein